jgi:hypothetical protein
LPLTTATLKPRGCAPGVPRDSGRTEILCLRASGCFAAFHLGARSPDAEALGVIDLDRTRQ